MRQITLYQLNANEAEPELRRSLIDGLSQPAPEMYHMTWVGHSKSHVTDQDLIYHVKNAGHPKTLGSPIQDGDIIAIDGRTYLLLSTMYRRLWEFPESGLVATSM